MPMMLADYTSGLLPFQNYTSALFRLILPSSAYASQYRAYATRVALARKATIGLGDGGISFLPEINGQAILPEAASMRGR